jgi:hypothetical protein
MLVFCFADALVTRVTYNAVELVCGLPVTLFVLSYKRHFRSKFLILGIILQKSYNFYI